MLTDLNLILIAIILFLIVLTWILYRLGFKQGIYKTDLAWQEKIPFLRRDIATNQRANIKGKVAETFAPFLPDFPYKPNECKFLGDPIDYLVFEGLNEREIKAIHFLEVKSDKSKLSNHQKQIKELVGKLKSKEITFKEFNFKTQDNENLEIKDKDEEVLED